MSANLENSAVATGLEKVSFHSNPKERQCQRMLKTTTQLHLSHTLAAVSGVTESRTRLSGLAAAAAHASKVMLKILQVRLQQYVNRELPDV